MIQNSQIVNVKDSQDIWYVTDEVNILGIPVDGKTRVPVSIPEGTYRIKSIAIGEFDTQEHIDEMKKESMEDIIIK